jgi:hypothetical protein
VKKAYRKLAETYIREEIPAAKSGRKTRVIVHNSQETEESTNLISSSRILPVFSLFHAALIFWYFFIKEKVQKDKKRAESKT